MSLTLIKTYQCPFKKTNSLDLDFDLLNETRANCVLEILTKIAKRYGHVKEYRKKRFSILLILSYQDDAPNIKIEFDRRNFGSQYEIQSYLGISMNVMVRDDMFAHKMVAMYERMGKANRDIFDVWFFGQNDWPVNKEIVEKMTEMSFSDFLRKCIEALGQLPDHDMLAGMGELLNEKQKAWEKANLRSEVIFQLKLMLELD